MWMNIGRVFEYKVLLGFVLFLRFFSFSCVLGLFWVTGIIVMVLMLVLWLQLPKYWGSGRSREGWSPTL